MTSAEPAAAPFTPRAATALVVGGIVLFFIVLWLIGSGMGNRQLNNGQAHAGSKGLTGYAAFVNYLGARGYRTTTVKAAAALRQPGALVLTPPAYVDVKALDRIVTGHRGLGPTIIISPKWNASTPSARRKDGKPGWVVLQGTALPGWEGFYDDITLALDKPRTATAGPTWQGAGLSGRMPDRTALVSGRGTRLVPLVREQGSGRILAAYIGDGGDYPALRGIAMAAEPDFDPDEAHGDYPVVFVFDPDLVANYGMSRPENALLGERIIAAALEGEDRSVAFDLTLNGFGRSRSLLTLAFEPPFLAATLCLMLAALVLGWRAFNRFGPAALGTRSLAFGKGPLVANAAALIRRTRRSHLIAEPYADAVQARLVRALALPARSGADDAAAAIDRALAARQVPGPGFAAAVAALRGARRPADIVRAARALHSLERTLTT